MTLSLKHPISKSPSPFLIPYLPTHAWNDIYDFKDKRIKTAYSIGSRFNCYLNPALYLRFFSIVKHNIHQLRPPNSQPLTKSLSFFLMKNPPTKTVRELIFPPPLPVNFSKIQPVILQNALSPSPYDETRLKNNIQFFNTWSLSFLPIELSNFALFFINRKITLNAQRSHFSDIPRFCTFCYRSPCPGNLPDENYDHLFLKCRFTQDLANSIFPNLLIVPLNLTDLLSHGCQLTHSEAVIVNIEIILFFYYIYKRKLACKFPTKLSYLEFTSNLKKPMLLRSKKYLQAYETLCRNTGKDILNFNKWLDFTQ